MILTCPSCDTRYSVDGAKFPAAGRTVRCAKCGHSWHQPGEGEAVPEAAPEIPAEAAPAPAPAEAPASDPFPVNPSPTRAFAPAAVASAPRTPLG
ncbi:MAG: zinc-ribbon domain-containing protein, partial [Alphaproteobacteria bacterium]